MNRFGGGAGSPSAPELSGESRWNPGWLGEPAPSRKAVRPRKRPSRLALSGAGGTLRHTYHSQQHAAVFFLERFSRRFFVLKFCGRGRGSVRGIEIRG